jgi:hypothetical protein
MKISGCTFIRNGVTLGYPFIESIKCLLMICDEVVVAVSANNADNTLQLIKELNDPKLIIIETTWNNNMQVGGYVYGQQKMTAQFNCSGDWVFYLECDEIIHQDDIPMIKAKLHYYLADPKVEAIAFKYYHFYGTPNLIANSPRWYKSEARIIKNNIRSYAPDGLFWVVLTTNKKGRYPNAILLNCYIYHYGHTRLAKYMSTKNKQVAHYWKQEVHQDFLHYGNIDPKTLNKFTGHHPTIMNDWLQNCAEKSLQLNHQYKLTSRDIRHRIMVFVGKLFHYEWSKKHYNLIAEK